MAEPAERDPLADLIDGYVPLPGLADEVFDTDGSMRPVWEPLILALAAIDDPDRADRFARGRQYLRDAGVFFRQYGEDASGVERDWPLSPVPVLIDEGEWSVIEAGLTQRADLLEDVMADLYGPGKLVRDGILPAEMVARNTEWLRPLVGVTPAGGHFLHFIAFDIARGPDGKWFVLGDRTQAPSGAGFALENRVATSRVFPELFQKISVHRLAGFFRRFRDAVEGMRHLPDSRPGILSPGPLNDTYFEHAYIARYLGFALLEGEDLTVDGGRVMVRTVEGPRPVEVLWRRLDAGFADPLELDGRSRLGTPGMVEAIRRGNLAMINALGSGLLETRAFLAFMPRICRALRGEPLLMANIATWWCGQAAERAYVEKNIARLTLGPALGNRLPFEADHPTVAGDADLPLAEWLARDGAALVGQETVRLSTTPVWTDEGLRPRPMTLRVFLARGSDGWTVMPGGYARIGRTDKATAVAMQSGGAVADVWVVSSSPVPRTSMLVPGAARAMRTPLPSRAADNLFWLGRYVERAETATRLLRAWHLRLAEGGGGPSPLLDRLTAHLTRMGIKPRDGFAAALSDRIDRARGCAGRLRDRFSADGWQALGDLSTLAREMEEVDPGDDAAHALSQVLRRVAGLAGLVHENMYRSVGWRFLSLGRSLERAEAMAAALASFADPAAPEGALELLIEFGDSVMTHRRRFPMGVGRDSVLDLLALDADNPRALLYHLADIRAHVDHLPQDDHEGPMQPLAREVLLLHTALAVKSTAEIDPAALSDLRAGLDRVSDLIGTRYFA